MRLEDFNSIVSGEKCSANIKNKASVQKEWTSPGLLMGNVYMNFQDNGGARARRILIIEFNNPITERDTNLSLRLKEGKMDFIIYSTMYYCSALNDVGHRDIWDSIEMSGCDYFKETRNHMCEETSLLAKFLNCENYIRLGVKDGYVSYQTFQDKFVEYCVALHRRVPVLTREYMDLTFEQYSVQKTCGSEYKLPGLGGNITVVKGLVFNEEHGSARNCYYPDNDIHHIRNQEALRNVANSNEYELMNS